MASDASRPQTSTFMPRPLPARGDQAADRAEPENAERAAAQPVRQRARPLAALHPLGLGHDVAARRQHQRHRQLGRRLRRTAVAVGHADAALGAGGIVDLSRVAADQRDQPQFRQKLDQRTREGDPLADRDHHLGIGKPGGQLGLVARRGAVAGHLVAVQQGKQARRSTMSCQSSGMTIFIGLCSGRGCGAEFAGLRLPEHPWPRVERET